MKAYNANFYAVSFLALVLVLGTLAFFVHEKTGSIMGHAAARSGSDGAQQSWADKEKNQRVVQPKMTPEEMREEMNVVEKRQYEQGAARRLLDYQYQLQTLDRTKQDEIDAMAKTDPVKAAAMAEDYKKFRAGMVAYHERELAKPWTPGPAAPLTIPDQP